MNIIDKAKSPGASDAASSIMALLSLIVLLIVFTAWRSGRPIKLVLTEDEARAVRARWWYFARAELRMWAVCFALGCALVYDPLAAAHWKPVVYAAIVWASLVLFSRLAIWITLAGSLLAFGVDIIAGTFGKPLFPPQIPVIAIMFTIAAVVFRAFVMLARPRQLLLAPPRPPTHELETRIH